MVRRTQGENIRPDVIRPTKKTGETCCIDCFKRSINFLLGVTANKKLIDLLKQSIQQVSPSILSYRLREIAKIRNNLQRCDINAAYTTWQNKAVNGSGISAARSLRSSTSTPRPVTLDVIPLNYTLSPSFYFTACPAIMDTDLSSDPLSIGNRK